MPPDDCTKCRPGTELGVEFSFAFQPIVNIVTGKVFAYEALVRGRDGANAASVMSQLTDANRYQFDQAARSSAIATATELFGETDALLSLNVIPNAVYDPERCLRSTLQAANAHGFPLERLMFEFTEHERVTDVAHLRRIAHHYASCGFTTAIDDFGAGFAGLSFLAEFVPDIVKIDRHLLTGVESDRVRQSIVDAVCGVARDLDVVIIAEGIETAETLAYLAGLGIELFQGYYVARPEFQRLPPVHPVALQPELAAPKCRPYSAACEKPPDCRAHKSA